MTSEQSSQSGDVVTTPGPLRGIITLLNALVGMGLMAWGFLGGIDSALNGGGSGASPVFSVLFFIGAILVLVALIVSIIRLAKGLTRALSVVTILVCLLPVVGVIVLRLAAVGAS